MRPKRLGCVGLKPYTRLETVLGWNQQVLPHGNDRPKCDVGLQAASCPARGSLNRGADADGANDGPDRIAMAPIDARMGRVFVLGLVVKNSVSTARACGRRAGILLAAQSIRPLCRGRTRTACRSRFKPRLGFPAGYGRIAYSSRIYCNRSRRLPRRGGCNIVFRL